MSGSIPPKILESVTLIGLDKSSDLAPSIEKILSVSELIAGPSRWLDELGRFKAQKLPLSGKLEDWLKDIEVLSREKNVAVLASGDPNFYGLAKKLLTIIPPERVRIIPSTTTVQKAFARIKISWADVPVVSLHGRGFSREFFPALYRAGLQSSPGYLAVYTDPTNTPSLISEKILERGLDGWKITVCEDLDTDSEKIRTLSLEEAAKTKFSDLNLTILERDNPFPPIKIGAPEMDFAHEEGMITKSEVRAVALSKLSLTGIETLWDIGAGSGAVAIEAGRLLPYGEVFAVEKNPKRFEQARANVSLYGAANVNVILGNAKDSLNDLPDPDRVFLGGGGKELDYLIEECKKRILPKGVIVASVISLESLNRAVSALSGKDGVPDLTQILVSKSHTIANTFYFKPLNPIYLVRGEF
ncbi:MAG: precorrin-6y C5,15-methyltransferase (decarboxylating) subunit CbiE [Deltaproteobacteria bacterium]|jgi:precorrin-6Y C5,15-methyltransferase (decarboxylating)|nr:precorrin-6y C5,15-methyltransferase (decarboxylating) subunit CbiE [Deltaproteobacteria bacterium]